MNVAENSPQNLIVFTYNSNTVTGKGIRFVPLDDTSPFSIPSTGDGHVTVAGSLDFEKRQQYTLNNI